MGPHESIISKTHSQSSACHRKHSAPCSLHGPRAGFRGPFTLIPVCHHPNNPKTQQERRGKIPHLAPGRLRALLRKALLVERAHALLVQALQLGRVDRHLHAVAAPAATAQHAFTRSAYGSMPAQSPPDEGCMINTHNKPLASSDQHAKQRASYAELTAPILSGCYRSPRI